MYEQASTQSEQDKNETASLAGKYLTFKLATEEYGIEILKVQEIIKFMNITPIPRTPDYMKGVVNLRGKVIPVIDLRSKFGIGSIEATDRTCIIVLQILREGGKEFTVGSIVDEVSEVLDIHADDIERPSEMYGSGETSFIMGLAKAKGSVKVLLNINEILSIKEITQISMVM